MCWSCKELTDTQFEITPKIVCLATCQTWILPSSHQLGFLHLTIHVRYIRGQTMLIRCYFAIIVMVDTIILLQIGAHSSSRPHLVLFIMFSCSTLISAQTMPCFSRLKSKWGGIHENFISTSSCALYICVCIFFWLISFYLRLVLVFLFNKIYYGFTPL